MTEEEQCEGRQLAFVMDGGGLSLLHSDGSEGEEEEPVKGRAPHPLVCSFRGFQVHTKCAHSEGCVRVCVYTRVRCVSGADGSESTVRVL